MKNMGIGVHGGSRRLAARPAIVSIIVLALTLLGPWGSGIEAAQGAA